MFAWLKSLLKRKGGVKVQKRKVDYIKNCVEEKTGHTIPDHQYRKACERSYEVNCKNMQDRIDAIARYL